MILSPIQENSALQKSMASPQEPVSMQLSQTPNPGVRDSPTYAVCTTVPAAWGCHSLLWLFVPLWEQGGSVYFAG